MKKIYIFLPGKYSSCVILKCFFAALIFSIAYVRVLGQSTSSDFVSINWTTAASQQYAVNEAQGRVVNGKLYTFGGFDSRKPGLLPTKRSYVYNPKTNSWSAIASLPYTPNGSNFGGVTHAGIATDGTDIYLAGGVTADSVGTGSIEGTKQVWKYIISQNAYTKMPDLPVDIGSGQLEYLNGELHYFGGFSLDRAVDLATHYVLNLNNLADGWKNLAPLPNPRQHAGSIVFGGKIYSIGGQIGENDTLITQKDVNVYDPATDSWTRVADLPVPSGATGRGHISSAVVISGQRILVLAGETVHITGRTNMVSAYSPATNSWQNLTPLSSSRYSGVAAVFDSSIYYTAGSVTNITFRGTPTPQGLTFSSSAASFYVTQNGTVANRTINLLSNQGTPPVSLTKSVNSDWLILPSQMLGSLSFGINASGLLPGNYVSTVTASSQGYTDAILPVALTVYPPGTLVPLADAYVRDGSYAAINYGSDTSLVAKSSTSSGYTRSSYLKYSLNNISSIASAKLRIYGSNTDNTSSVNISSYGVDNDTWTESGITRNNAPAASTTALSSVAVNNQKKYYELDVTNDVKIQFTGDKTASFLIKDPSNQNINLAFNSKENTQNPPQLFITTADGDVTSPVVSVQFNGISNSPNIFNNQVEVIIKASDEGGSGLEATEYSLNGTAFQTYNSSFIINTPGNDTIKARAKDGNGNVTVTNEIAFSVISAAVPAYDTLTPIADAFTRDGSYAGINYGNDTTLVVKGSSSSGYTRFSYLKFSLENVSNIASAKLRIYGRNKDNTLTTNISSYGVDNDSWSESNITWKNAPSATTTALSSASVNDQTKYYEFDVTNFVKTQLSSDKIVCLLIKDPTNQNRNLAFNSKENAKNNPQLVIITTADTIKSAALRNISNIFGSIDKLENPRVYPNPIEKRLNIVFPVAYQGNFSFEIIDQTGRIYNMGKVRIQLGGSNIDFDISNFSLHTGVYFLKIKSETTSDQIKLIVE